MKEGYIDRLKELIKESREHDHLRFGQRLYGVLVRHDQETGKYDEHYDHNFHERLFYIEDDALLKALEEWDK